MMWKGRMLGAYCRWLVVVLSAVISAYLYIEYGFLLYAADFTGPTYDSGGIDRSLGKTLEETSSLDVYPNASTTLQWAEMEQQILSMHTGNRTVDRQIDKLLAINQTTDAAYAHRIHGHEAKAFELDDPEYSCNRFSLQTQCSFRNLCVYRATTPQQHWFTFKDMGYNNSQPANIRRMDRKVWSLNITTYDAKDDRFVDIPSASPIKVIIEDTYIFNMQFGHRYYIYLRALCLLQAIETLTGLKPYNLLYLTHFADGTDTLANLKYFNEKQSSVVEKITHKHRQLGTFPASLSDIKEDVVCFAKVHFGYDANLTATFQGTTTTAKLQHTKRVQHNPYYQNNIDVATKILPRYQERLVNRYRIQDIPMQRNRCLLVTRRAGRRDNEVYRRILNEVDVVRLLEDAGLEVDMVDFQTISDYEQIIRTRMAGVFVAMHGAGMSNTMWLHPQAVVIELQTYGFQKWGYRNFLRAMGIHYEYWVNTHTANAVHTYKSLASEGSYDFYRGRDQIVDIKELRYVLNVALHPREPSDQQLYLLYLLKYAAGFGCGLLLCYLILQVCTQLWVWQGPKRRPIKTAFQKVRPD